MNAIQFQTIGLSLQTVSFLQSYNTGIAKSEAIDTRNQAAFGLINYHEVAAQLTKVLASSTFVDSKGSENGQSKQTFKISVQRYFRNAYQGKALVIKGNTCTIHNLATNETTDFKGKVIIAKTAQEIADDKAEQKKVAANKAQQDIDAKQAIQRLAVTKSALDQAENTAAAAVKAANDAKKAATIEIEKAQSSAEMLAAQVADLTLQLERITHENSATVAEYQSMLADIRKATSLKALKSKYGASGFIAMEFPERNLRQVATA